MYKNTHQKGDNWLLILNKIATRNRKHRRAAVKQGMHKTPNAVNAREKGKEGRRVR